MCACARKKGWNAPFWYQRTSISGSGLPKKPPTSAAADNELDWIQYGLSAGRVCRTAICLTAVESHPCDAIGEDHGSSYGEVLPRPHIVAGPDGTVSLRACKEGAGQDERSSRRILSRNERLGCQVVLEAGQAGISTVNSVLPVFTSGDDAIAHVDHSIDVVQITVLPPAVVDVVARHGDLWPVEDGRLWGGKLLFRQRKGLAMW